MRGNSAQLRPVHWTDIGAFSSSSRTDNRALQVSKKLDAVCLVLEDWVGLHKCTLDSFFVLLLDLLSLWSWSVKTERLWTLGGNTLGACLFPTTNAVRLLGTKSSSVTRIGEWKKPELCSYLHPDGSPVRDFSRLSGIPQLAEETKDWKL